MNKLIDRSKAILLVLLCLTSLTGFSQQQPLPVNRWTADKAVINQNTTMLLTDTAKWLVLKKAPG